MEQNKDRKPHRIKIIMSAASLLSGLLAGENVFRYTMEVPGWRHIDISLWGEYSRNADLKGGAFILPFEAIVCTLLFISASIIIIRNKSLFNSGVLWIHLSAAFALIGLGLTFFAAPYMLSVRTIANDPILLQQIFDHFHFWGSFRAIAQVLSFVTCVLAIAKL